MAEKIKPPFICHVFICTHDREGERRSCVDGGSHEIRKALKEEVAARGWKGRVRISKSGCLGICDMGPAAVIYPQDIWFSNVSLDDAEMIIARVGEILKESG